MHYSAHIRRQKEKIEEITRKILEDESVKKKLSNSVVEILKDKKDIRKIKRKKNDKNYTKEKRRKNNLKSRGKIYDGN